MARGKVRKTSSMRGKKPGTKMNKGRVGERETGKKVGGRVGRTATAGRSRQREAQLEMGSLPTRRMAAAGGRTLKGRRRPRKSDI